MPDIYTLALDRYKVPYSELNAYERKEIEIEIEEYIMTNGVGH